MQNVTGSLYTVGRRRTSTFLVAFILNLRWILSTLHEFVRADVHVLPTRTQGSEHPINLALSHFTIVQAYSISVQATVQLATLRLYKAASGYR